MLKEILKGSAWTVLLQYSNRFLGLISTVILARILTPDDYGIVAISMIFIHFIHQMSSAGVGQYLLSSKDLDVYDIRTSFTILVISRFLLASLIFIYSAELASFFNDHRLELVLKVVSLIPVVLAFRNINVVLFERNLKYQKVFVIGIHRKFFSFLVALVLAFSGYKYFALIYAELGGAIYFVLVSYIYFPLNMEYFLPSLRRFKKQLGFSGWAFFQTLVGFLKGKLDSILVGKFLNVSDLGVYQLTHTISSIPSEQLITPISRPFLSGISKFKARSDEQIEIFNKTIVITNLAIFFLACLLSTVSHEVTLILLGQKWAPVAPLVEIISISYAISSSCSLITKLMVSHRKMKEILLADLLNLFIIVILLASALLKGNLLDFAYVKVLIAVELLLLSLLFASIFCRVNPVIILKLILPVAMIAISSFIIIKLIFLDIKLVLICALFVKIFCYVFLFAFLLLIWSYFSKFMNLEFQFINQFYHILKDRLKHA